VYGRGAEKYTRYGECSCVEIADSLSQLTLEVAAVTVTKSGSETIIPCTQKDNEKTVVSGEERIQKKRNGRAPYMQAAQSLGESTSQLATDYHWRIMIGSLPFLAGFAVSQVNLDTLTITLRQVMFEGLSVMDATSVWDSLKSVDGAGRLEHRNGCGALVQIETGDRNWEKGYKWSLNVAALQRHLYLWLMGEDVDPETGCRHLAQVAWHAFALMTFSQRGLGTDDVTMLSSTKYL